MAAGTAHVDTADGAAAVRLTVGAGTAQDAAATAPATVTVASTDAADEAHEAMAEFALTVCGPESSAGLSAAVIPVHELAVVPAGILPNAAGSNAPDVHSKYPAPILASLVSEVNPARKSVRFDEVIVDPADDAAPPAA